MWRGRSLVNSLTTPQPTSTHHPAADTRSLLETTPTYVSPRDSASPPSTLGRLRTSCYRLPDLVVYWAAANCLSGGRRDARVQSHRIWKPPRCPEPAPVPSGHTVCWEPHGCWFIAPGRLHQPGYDNCLPVNNLTTLLPGVVLVYFWCWVLLINVASITDCRIHVNTLHGAVSRICVDKTVLTYPLSTYHHA